MKYYFTCTNEKPLSIAKRGVGIGVNTNRPEPTLSKAWTIKHTQKYILFIAAEKYPSEGTIAKIGKSGSVQILAILKPTMVKDELDFTLVYPKSGYKPTAVGRKRLITELTSLLMTHHFSREGCDDC
ncbi:MAG: hypothetical protein ACXABY_00460 [Candidatus Thorarchaeota archaeon]|jgi:hypothetical protein